MQFLVGAAFLISCAAFVGCYQGLPMPITIASAADGGRPDKLEWIDLDLVDMPNEDFREKRSESLIENLVVTLLRGSELNPIRLAPMGERYRIKSGVSRLLAYRKAGRTTIPAVVTDSESTPLEELLDAYWENEDREDFARLERAAFGIAMMKAGNLKQNAVAPLLRMSTGQFSKLLTIFEGASEHVKELLSSGKLYGTFAEKLAAIPDHAMQNDLADKAIKFKWKRSRLVGEIAAALGKKAERGPRKKTYQDEDGFYMKYPANWTLKQTMDAIKKAFKKLRRNDSSGPGSPQPSA
jgi:ParB/RepB/Spo0J family partition protein